MATLREWVRRLWGTLRPSRNDRELEQELRQHLELAAEHARHRGDSPEIALRAAGLQVGSVAQAMEAVRDQRGLRWLEDVARDVRYGLRLLRRTPAFTATAALSLALGIGANAAIFNLVNIVLLRSLPVRHPEELVIVATREPGMPSNHRFSFQAFQALRDSHAFSTLAASAPFRINVDIDGQPSSTAAGQMASGNYHTTLGVAAALGRTLLPEDDAPSGASTVAVLGYGYWQRRFGGDSRVIGRVIRLNGLPFTIVGVSAPEFFGTHVGEAIDITVPLSTQPQVNADFGASLISGDGAYDFWLELIGRRQPAMSEATAQTAANGIYQQRILPEIVERFGTKRRGIGRPRLELEPGSRGLSELRRRFSQPLLLLMGVVALVLLIACANVANLLLARATSRRQEIAVRVSLGAGRARLVRQLLVESLILALGGGALGLVLAVWSGPTLAAFLGGDARSLTIGLDIRVLGFTLGVSIVTALVFGLAPAFSTSHVDAFAAMRESGHQVRSGGRRFGVRGSLVIGQVAVSLVLLVGAALFVRTLINLKRVNLGFDQEHVLALRLEPRGSNQKREHWPRLTQLYGSLLDRLHTVPGVRSVSLSGSTPLGNENPLTPEAVIVGAVPQAGLDTHVRLLQTYPRYLATMGIPLLAGRDLLPADNARALDDPRAPKVAVINDTMARRFFGAADAAIGRRVALGSRPGALTFEIVGVARDARDRALREEIQPLVYMTYGQAPTGRGQMTLLVRASGDPLALVTTIRELARGIDPAMPLLNVQTLADRVVAATRQEQLVALLSSLFGGLALLLASIGLYGVMAYAVLCRQAEFGVRLALGATPGGLARLVLGESLTLVGVGVAVGVVVAGATAQTVSRLLFDLSPFDPVAFAVAPGVLLAVATVAAYLPARHAAHVDPVVTLRQE